MHVVVRKFNKPQLSPVIKIRDKEYLQAFGTHLRAIRTKGGLSQEALELEAGVAKNQVGRIERGEINLSVSTVKRLADALGIQPKELFDF